MNDLATLAAALLANFRTVHIPARARASGKAETGGRRQRRGEPTAGPHALAATGCAASWSITAITGFCTIWNPTRTVDGGSTFSPPMLLLSRYWMRLTEGACGPGDPVSFDPNEFVSARLRHLVANDTNSS